MKARCMASDSPILMTTLMLTFPHLTTDEVQANFITTVAPMLTLNYFTLDNVNNELLYGGQDLCSALTLFYTFNLETKPKTCEVITPIYKMDDLNKTTKLPPRYIGLGHRQVA